MYIYAIYMSLNDLHIHRQVIIMVTDGLATIWCQVQFKKHIKET